MGSPSPNKSPEKCTICLAQIENRSVIDGCLHAFCYSCLKEWSKVKAVCPLCKQPFTFFMYNIRANDDFDKYEVPVPVQPTNDFHTHLQRFIRWESETNRVVDRWMSSRIHEWRERIQQDQENSRAAIVASTSVEVIRRRRRFYRDGMQVSHVRNNQRVRDISSQFYCDNPAQIHRLVPWLKRELIVLFGANNMMLVNRVCDLILSAIPTLGIQSMDFYDELKPYLMDRTDHFMKEFVSFAKSPHELATYDNNARYSSSRRRRIGAAAPWSSDDENDERPRHFVPHLYSTSLPEPPPLAHVRNQVSLRRNRPQKRRRLRSSVTSSPRAIVISSSSSGESEVEFVRFIKPPHQRTPDAVIDLSSDEETAGPSQRPATLEAPGTSQDSPIATRSTSSRSDDSDSSDVNVTLRSVVVKVKRPSDSSSRKSSSESRIIQSNARHRAFSSESSDCEVPRKHPRSDRVEPRRPLRKVFEKKRLRSDNDLTRRIPRRWSSSSESSNDFATPYVSTSSRHRRTK